MIGATAVQLALPGIVGAIEHHACYRCGFVRAPLVWRHVRESGRVAVYVQAHHHERDRSASAWCRRCAPTQRGAVPDHITAAAWRAIMHASSPAQRARWERWREITQSVGGDATTGPQSAGASPEGVDHVEAITDATGSVGGVGGDGGGRAGGADEGTARAEAEGTESRAEVIVSRGRQQESSGACDAR